MYPITCRRGINKRHITNTSVNKDWPHSYIPIFTSVLHETFSFIIPSVVIVNCTYDYKNEHTFKILSCCFAYLVSATLIAYELLHNRRMCTNDQNGRTFP